MLQDKFRKRFKSGLEHAWNSLCRFVIRSGRYQTKRLGSEYGGWSFCPTDLCSSSVIYSMGIGEDISFDLALIESHQCSVYAFDPTPRSIEWIEKQTLPEKFKWFGFGIAHHDGEVSFFPPANQNYVSHTILNNQPSRSTPITVQVKRLSTIMNEMGHQEIDMLKMDIEGAEYETIKDFLSEDLKIHQILVEFHHFFSNVGLWKTIEAVGMLYLHGYKLTSLSMTGHEYSFIRHKR